MRPTGRRRALEVPGSGSDDEPAGAACHPPDSERQSDQEQGRAAQRDPYQPGRPDLACATGGVSFVSVVALAAVNSTFWWMLMLAEPWGRITPVISYVPVVGRPCHGTR